MAVTDLHVRHVAAGTPRGKARLRDGDRITEKLDTNVARYVIAARDELCSEYGTHRPYAKLARRILGQNGTPTAEQVRRRAQRLSEHFGTSQSGPPWSTIESVLRLVVKPERREEVRENLSRLYYKARGEWPPGYVLTHAIGSTTDPDDGEESESAVVAALQAEVRRLSAENEALRAALDQRNDSPPSALMFEGTETSYNARHARPVRGLGPSGPSAPRYSESVNSARMQEVTAAAPPVTPPAASDDDQTAIALLDARFSSPVVESLIAGRYRVIRALGGGGMGRVWLARDELLRRDVAIKEIVLPFGLPEADREELRLRTLREARSAAQLSHPNVVQIYNVQPGDQQTWLVMEYVRSRSLLQLIEENGPLPVEQVANIGLSMLSALGAANRVGVLHRDVKPSNVLIADDGRVVLTDFGSATMDESELTRTGVILGSPQYIAPERIEKGVSTSESDLWSLGATLYAAVEGRPPYTRSTTLRSLIAVTTEKPDPAHRAGALKPILNGLLQRNPQARFTAKEVEQRLRRVADVQRTVHLHHIPERRRPEFLESPYYDAPRGIVTDIQPPQSTHPEAAAQPEGSAAATMSDHVRPVGTVKGMIRVAARAVLGRDRPTA